MSKRFLAIDPGKHSTKAMAMKPDGQVKFLTFRTKMEETNREFSQGDSFITCFEGKRYLVGDQAEVVSSKTSKAELIHKVAAYTAIHQLAESGDELEIAVGCPLSVFENRQLKKDYKNFLFPAKEISVAVNGTTKHFTISRVVVLPESAGILYSDGNDYRNMKVGIVDLGGLNVNGCVYDKTMPVISSLFTDNLGSNVLTQNLKRALEQKYGEDIPDYMLDDILHDGYLIDNMSPTGEFEGSREFISNFKKDHVQKVINKCNAMGWNLRTMRLVFVGGTTKLLSNEIKAALPGAIIAEEPEKANVKGFLKHITE